VQDVVAASTSRRTKATHGRQVQARLLAGNMHRQPFGLEVRRKLAGSEEAHHLDKMPPPLLLDGQITHHSFQPSAIQRLHYMQYPHTIAYSHSAGSARKVTGT
jgi:hypothetical protein